MSRQWISRQEMRNAEVYYAQRVNALREVVLELCAALVRMDRNGYQTRTLERAYKATGVTAEQVNEYNAKRQARINARTTRAGEQ